MTRKIIALATATMISLTAAAPAVHAMGMEFNMLTGAVFNELRTRGLPTEGIHDLTLGQLAQIKAIVDGDDGEGNKTQRIRAIMRR